MEKKFRAEGSVFMNFHDERKVSIKKHTESYSSVLSKIPSGQRVTLVISKDEMGKINVPLDLMAAEMIS